MPEPTKDHPYDCKVTCFETADGGQRVVFSDCERGVTTYSTYDAKEVDACMTIYAPLPRGAAVLAYAIGEREQFDALAKPHIRTKAEADAEIKREIEKWQEGA